MPDPKRRAVVMGRSRKLGHCICNPKLHCPCDIYNKKNVCLCAGERLPDAPEKVELTKFVESAGCASKISQNDLKIALAGLPPVTDPRVLISSDSCDDAGVFKISDDLALVQSVDVFTPNVDDPYTFGQIAAANSVSDIYAMGGTPLTALSIIAFPIEKLNHSVMNDLLRGGMDKMAEAGVSVIGGHSLKDNEVKFGFAVTGTIDPNKMVTNNSAEPGDVLILTKPLGAGIISFAHQLDRAFPFNIQEISISMATLNREAAEVMREKGIRCGTDVTGFGLMGHLAEMVVQSKVTAEITTGSIPLFGDVLMFAQQDLISGAVERNREFASTIVSFGDDIGPDWQAVLFDPQTSGGILMAVPEKEAHSTLTLLREKGISAASIIGRITEKSDGRIIVRSAL